MENIIRQNKTASSFHWYIWYTRPRAEKKIQERLRQKEIDVFLPLSKALRQWSDRKKWIEEPLFSGYIFTRITPKQIDHVAQTEGILTWLRSEGKPAFLQDRQVEEIRQLLSHHTSPEISQERLLPGEPIHIIHGPLAGLSGEIVHYRGNKKLMVRIEQLGKALLVELSDASVLAQKRA